MTRRLIVLGSSLTALAVLRDAASLGLEVVVVAEQDGPACVSRHVSRLVWVPADAEDDGLARWIGLGEGGRHPLIASSDRWLTVIQRHRGRLERAFSQILHPGAQALDICLRKEAFAVFCSAAGLPAPLSWRVGQEARPEGMRCPLILRPIATRHSAGVRSVPKALEVQDEAELAQGLALYAAAGAGVLASASLLGRALRQYSVPFVRWGGEFHSVVAVKRRPFPEQCRVGSYVELEPQAEVEAMARRALVALDYQGIGEVEVLHDLATGENYLIEINARPWLQYALAVASGQGFLAVCLGLPRPARQDRQGWRWMEWHSDLYCGLSRSEGLVRHGRLSLVAYLYSQWRANVHAAFTLSDPWPALPALARRLGLRPVAQA